MRRLSLGLYVVLLSTGFYVACSAFGGSDASPPLADSGVPADGSSPPGDGDVPPTGLDGSNDPDTGTLDAGTSDAGCSPVLFSLVDCMSPPALTAVDGGVLTTSVAVPPGASGTSCAFSLSAGGTATFEKTFDTYIGKTTSLELMVQPTVDSAVSFLGCSVAVHAGTQTTTMSLAQLGSAQGGGLLLLHVQDTGSMPPVDAINGRHLQMDLGKDLVANAWNQLTFNVGANTEQIVLAPGANGTASTIYNFTAPADTMGQITLKCGAVSAGTDFGVLIDSIKLTTARCN